MTDACGKTESQRGMWTHQGVIGEVLQATIEVHCRSDCSTIVRKAFSFWLMDLRPSAVVHSFDTNSSLK